MKVFGCFVFHNFCFVLNIKIAFHLEKNFLNSFHFHEPLCTEMGSFPSSLSTCQSKYLKSHVCINMLFFFCCFPLRQWKMLWLMTMIEMTLYCQCRVVGIKRKMVVIKFCGQIASNLFNIQTSYPSHLCIFGDKRDCKRKC